MARDLGAALLAEISAKELTPIILLEMIFDSGPLRLWSGVGELDWNSVTWTGSGNLLAFEAIVESPQVVANGVRFTLSGVNPAIVSLALSEPYQDRPARMYLGALDAAGAVVGTPYRPLDGLMDNLAIRHDGESATVALAVEHRLVKLDRPRERRHTPEDQAIDYPDDRGLAYIASLQNASFVWG